MGIIYLISVLFLCISFILIKKTNKVIDIVSFIGITIVLLLSYNVFVCYVINFLTIPITLVNLSIINLLFGIIMLGIILKTREVQKFELNKFSLICVLIILVAVLIVAYLNFGFPFNIKYETGDPAVHYLTSVLFAEQDSLLNLTSDEVYGLFSGRKIGSYVNSGIIMKCCSGFMDVIDYYNIFIGFGIFILFMTGAVMYSTLEKYTNSKGGRILALIVSLIYILGYPLNSLLFGFEYLSLGLLILGTIIHMIYYFENEELKFPFYLIIFALLNLSVFCSYYMFVPFTYSALWIYFCIYSKRKNKKILCKKNIIMLVVTLLIPFFLGYIYNLAPTIYNILQTDAVNRLKEAVEFSMNIINNNFSAYGYIYVNFYSNMILLIPIAVYYIYKKIKEKEYFSCDIILLVFLLLFIGVLGIGIKFELVSTYFLMKNYYALWLILFYLNFRGLMYTYKTNKAKTYAIVLFYVLVIICNLVFIDAPLDKEEYNENENISNVVEIFGVNKTIITDRELDCNLEEIDILKYAKENIDFDNNSVEILGSSEQIYWAYSMIRYVNYEEALDNPIYDGQNKLTIKAMNAYKKIGKVNYMIYFTKSKYYQAVDDFVFEGGEVIYLNGSGGIIKYEID